MVEQTDMNDAEVAAAEKALDDNAAAIAAACRADRKAELAERARREEEPDEEDEEADLTANKE